MGVMSRTTRRQARGLTGAGSSHATGRLAFQGGRIQRREIQEIGSGFRRSRRSYLASGDPGRRGAWRAPGRCSGRNNCAQRPRTCPTSRSRQKRSVRPGKRRERGWGGGRRWREMPPRVLSTRPALVPSIRTLCSYPRPVRAPPSTLHPPPSSLLPPPSTSAFHRPPSAIATPSSPRCLQRYEDGREQRQPENVASLPVLDEHIVDKPVQQPEERAEQERE